MHLRIARLSTIGLSAIGRMLVIGLFATTLCSCRGPIHSQHGAQALPVGYENQTLPPTAFAGPMANGMATDPPVGPPGMEQGVPMAYAPAGPWAPPGMSQPWPEDEYLRDGGDRGLPAEVSEQWEVRGLELEDTIAHYDTVEGERIVEPSNRVHIYSPRFGAVRQVVSLRANQQRNRTAGVYVPEILVGPTTVQLVADSKQNIQAERQVGTKSAVDFRTRQGDGVVSTRVLASGFHQDFFLPYENIRVIRQGVLEGSEMAWLARGHTAAVAWAHDQAVQVILDHRAAMAQSAHQSIESVYTVKEPPANPKLRVIKVASTGAAEPGDEVSFTIRFDNVGNQTIGNVTIIDNLTTRLQYVDGSGQCSLDAAFSTEVNEGDSLAVRCEVADPLEPGDGGVVRFRCKVR
ncbi:MAG TPA: hypothetical protein VE890_04145 [Thermoguttaceae bacterium]|nr:hypothetical protein [Thermoguttaceae bacterium]